MIKNTLREEYLRKRKSIEPKERFRMDDLLLLQFQQFNYETVHTLFTFWPIENTAEPNTHLFTGYLRHMVPDLHIAYPVTNTLTHEMNAISIHEETIYRTNAWGITEPKEGSVIPPEQVDLVLVPMLVCDKNGFRVGYGKGFYDRYLSKCRKDIVKIGFSYFDPVEKITDTDQFDVPLSLCITPQHIYEF